MLMTMGLMGFIPFILILRKAYLKSKKILYRSHKDVHLACLVLFLAPFLMLQTTETIVTTMSFWVFLHILCVYDRIQVEREKY